MLAFMSVSIVQEVTAGIEPLTPRGSSQYPDAMTNKWLLHVILKQFI